MTGHRFSLEFIANIDKPDVFTLPTPFNVDKHDTGLFNVVVPDTFNISELGASNFRKISHN